MATDRDTTIALDAGIDGLAHLFTNTGPDTDVPPASSTWTTEGA